MSVYLIRHGETEWSANGRHTGRTDVALTASGETEARNLAAVLAGIRFDRIFSSPALRARRTCELAGLEGSVTIDHDLAEWDYGSYEGELSTSIRRERPDWTVFRDGCPGGETAGDVSDRADNVIARLRMLDGNVALFSHGQFACSLAARWIGLPVMQAQHLQLGTAALGVLGFNPSHPNVPVIARWNIQGARPSSDANGSQMENRDAHKGSYDHTGRQRNRHKPAIGRDHLDDGQ